MYKLTWDMTPNNMININHIMKQNGVPNNIVEIGCYEGHTTVTMSDLFTKYNPDLKIYAIDPHEGSVEIEEDPEHIQRNFVYNINQCAQKNIEYIRKYSEDGLIDLINRKLSPEFIFIDGDHRASTVISDLVLSFKLIKQGGIILCDDATDWKYTDKNGTSSAQMSPRMAIESFINCHWHNIEIIRLPNMSQTAFRKLCP
jgi:predicted O-methyltransferase YrrM